MADTNASSFVSRLKSPIAGLAVEDNGPKTTAFASTTTTYDDKLNAESNVISSLVARQSALPTGSAYDQVASAVLAANARSAESELRSARLRAEASSKNWLPTVGPSISLTSLSDVIVNLVVDQVLFDNGRKKGEREFAKADVEVAAVALAQDTNDRAATSLELYLAAAEGREKTALAKDMAHFEYIMSERVRGGVSDMSDLNIIRQKLSEIRASQTAGREATRSAIAELNAMSVQPLQDVRGVTTLNVAVTDAQPLNVAKAEAEMTRSIAAAKIERAGNLPGVSLSGTVGKNGGVGINAGGAQLGFGTGARLKAIEVAAESAGRRVSQANEDSNRALRKLESQIAAKTRQASEASGLTAQAKNNLDLFQAQYKAGQRQVMDVVGVYETFSRAQEAEVTLKFEAATLRVEMARILGVLADGDLI
ncbi:MAG: TolC family protein [Ascidiaceihabitans sp.]|nr:TolC family protein [Ascidiaceihabitans sp.]